MEGFGGFGGFWALGPWAPALLTGCGMGPIGPWTTNGPKRAQNSPNSMALGPMGPIEIQPNKVADEFFYSGGRSLTQ